MICTVFPLIRPAGINFFQGLQLQVLLERGYYSREGINVRKQQFLNLNPAFLILKGCNTRVLTEKTIDQQQLIAIQYHPIITSSHWRQPMTSIRHLAHTTQLLLTKVFRQKKEENKKITRGYILISVRYPNPEHGAVLSLAQSPTTLCSFWRDL